MIFRAHNPGEDNRYKAEVVIKLGVGMDEVLSEHVDMSMVTSRTPVPHPWEWQSLPWFRLGK